MAQTIEYYLSKGFDRKAAEYYALGRKRLTGVVPNDDFTLTLTYNGSERRRFDVRPLLRPGTVFAPFADLTAFRRVYLDESGAVAWDIDPGVDSGVHWNNKVDLCPDGCYLDSVPEV